PAQATVRTANLGFWFLHQRYVRGDANPPPYRPAKSRRRTRRWQDTREPETLTTRPISPVKLRDVTAPTAAARNQTRSRAKPERLRVSADATRAPPARNATLILPLNSRALDTFGLKASDRRGVLRAPSINLLANRML